MSISIDRFRDSEINDSPRGQGASRARLELVSRVHECAQEGCCNLAMDERYCNRCREEIDGLGVWREEQHRERERHETLRAIRQQERAERLDRRLKTAFELWLSLWDWLRHTDALNWALSALLAFAIAYISVQYSEATVEWLKSLAGVR